MSQQQQEAAATIEADTMLDVYIHDYLVKRKLDASTKAFEDEAKVPMNLPAIETPRGFLFEWWTIFWDTFISRYKRHQGPTESSSEDVNNLMISLMNPSNAGSEGSLSGAHATRGLTDLALKGWPLMGLDQIQPQLLQQQQAMSLEHQIERQLLLQNMMGIRKNPQLNLVDHTLQSDGLRQVQVGHPLMLPKQHLENVDHGQQRFPQKPANFGHASQHSNYALVSSSVEVGPSLFNTSHEDHQASIHQMARKRKQPLPSSGVANSSGNARDITSTPTSPHNDKINIDDFLNYGASDGNNNPSLSHAGFTFLEIGSIHAASVDCCDISFDGKLVGTGGQDKKARVWHTDSREINATLDEHSRAITDIRFSPSMLRLATSSHDKTIRVWDVENPGNAMRTFTGHTASVMSLDFHPKKEDLICSCDKSEIRYWTIKNAGCVRVAKGGANQVRFQPGLGKHLAAVVGNSVSLLDLENPRACRRALKGHASDVQSISWDSSGEHLVSVSEDMVRVWKTDSGEDQNCVHELNVTGKRFRCAVFHPCYPSLVIIGCYQGMELWNMAENKMMTAVEEPISALAISTTSSLVASGHNDGVIKLWK